jgi:two-component system, chemotaxis family, protein-glutamate methylesterase/glutaminase
MREQKVQVLIVDDSSSVRMLLGHILDSDPRIQVIGTANNGREALEFVRRKIPDLILMDILMPEMDGFEATRRIMETQPVPIVICTGNAREAGPLFRLMEAGAVACVEKPIGTEHKDFEEMVANLLQTVILMSQVKVVRRWRRHEKPNGATAPVLALERAPAAVEVIGIGASTGGPPVLQTILAGLPKDFPVPILVVQHIASGFLAGLADWLNQTTGLQVHIAAYGIQPLPGHVYLAADDFHMGVGAGVRLVLSKEEPDNGLRPSVGYLFRSLAEVCGRNAVGVLLTGMGRDGAEQLKLMKDRGAFTIAQDRETSVVHGMPGEAIALNAATCVLPADKIAQALIAAVKKGRNHEGDQL